LRCHDPAGAIALKLIPVEQYPQITPPVVNVRQLAGRQRG
jgi:multidrug efflux pump subunit AcrB